MLKGLLNPVPVLYRWAALALLILACLGFAFMKGVRYEERKEDARALQAERATIALKGQRTEATSKVEMKYAPALTQVRTVTKEIIRYVDRFLPPPAVAACPELPPGFRVLHDAATAGRVPDPASVPDAAPAPIEDVAAAVADNYGTCKENALQLEGLQEWVREQQRLNKRY